jgi:hypothetical protein
MSVCKIVHPYLNKKKGKKKEEGTKGKKNR